MANPKSAQRVEVLRPFMQNKKIVGIKSVLDLPTPVAIELRSANKVKFVQADTPLKDVETLDPPADGSLPGQEAKPTGTAKTKGDGSPAK